MHWPSHGSCDFESASILVSDTYGDTVYDAAPVIAGDSVSGLVEDHDDWNLDDSPLSRIASLWTSLCVHSTAIQT